MEENFITSPENPLVKEFRRLSSQKKHRDKTGLFPLEGARLCRDAARYLEAAGEQFPQVLATPSALERYGEALEEIRGRAARFSILSEELAARLSDTQTPQGVFAVCKKLDKLDFPGTIWNGGRYVVLYGLQDPGNVGTILRTADALGLSGAVLCGGCDLYNPKTVRSTMGSLFHLPVWERGWQETVSAFQKAGIPLYAAVPHEDAVPVTECSFSGGAAVAIGNEGAGLSQEAAGQCSQRITIPMGGRAESLNAAMAAGILMWEMQRDNAKDRESKDGIRWKTGFIGCGW